MEEKVIKEDIDIEETDVTDELLIVEALAELLDVDAGFIEKKYPDEDYGYSSHIYENTEDNSEYLVCSYDEAAEYARENLENMVEDLGPIDAYGMDTVENYLDQDWFDDMLEGDVRDQVYNMDEDELIDEMERYGIISDDDKVSEGNGELEDDDTFEEDDMYYPKELLDSKEEELIEAIINSYGDDGIEYMKEVYGDIEEYIRNNPDCVDVDELIKDQLSWGDFGSILNYYDGSEDEISYEDEYGDRVDLYVYRVN